MPKNILITGGAGFIGINSADYFLKKRYNVTILDNLSRRGSLENLKWLSQKWGSKFAFVKADVTQDRKKIDKLVRKADAILHLAAQVAVTTSVQNPLEDFMINAFGTLNILESIRLSPNRPIVIFSSTNKVYGNLEHALVEKTGLGYKYVDLPQGVSENCLVDFHSPYGCSKGSADKYVRDYARVYGLRTVVFRQSCIYGPHQFGVEDQGWVAWFAISSLAKRPITIYGDGHQVRDVLYIEDLCRLYEMSIKNISKVSGQIYNIGGGYKNTASVLGAIAALDNIFKKPIQYSFADWRTGDQKVYVSDISKIKSHLGWEPKVGFERGLKRMADWLKTQKYI